MCCGKGRCSTILWSLFNSR